MPMAVCPRLTNWESLKVMVLAAETCTAAGIWLQFGRVASNCGQPSWQEVSASAGRPRCRRCSAPVCWSAKPWLLLGPSQLVPVKVIPVNEMWCAGAS